MRNLITYLVITIFLTSISFAQFDQFEQGISGIDCIGEEANDDYSGQIGGYVLSSQGTIRVLFVFLQFPDDNYEITNPYWVKGEPPTNINSWVNETWTSNPIYAR